ncbi:MAG: efflux transporter outer membrane subunit [Spongiibacteraceae bacterium]
MKQPRVYFVAGLILSGALTGCSVGPDYERPTVSAPNDWHEHSDNDSWKIANPADAQHKGEWWTIFNDTQLNALQQQAQLGNLQLQAAVARLDQARALTQVSRAALFPTVGLEAQRTRTRTSANRPANNSDSNGGTSNNVTSTLRDNNTIAATVNYEVDLFGRARRTNEASKAEADQAVADFENIKLLLAADVAANYFQLRALTTELNVLDQSIAGQSGILDIVRGRYADGLASGIDLAQQELIVANNRGQRELLSQQYEQQRHALATLLGIRIDELKIDLAPLQGELPTIPLALPSDLLQRRPDIASAERAVAAANAQIGVAKSAWFPTLNIAARDGFESAAFNQLFDSPSVAWSVGAGLAQTLFDAGATSGHVKFAQAKHTETVANYRATVLTAWQEVEDNLSNARTLAAAQRNAQQARLSANKIADVTDDRYQAGLASAVERYTARQIALNAQREEVQLSAQQWRNAVELIKALGGGWSEQSVAVTYNLR